MVDVINQKEAANIFKRMYESLRRKGIKDSDYSHSDILKWNTYIELRRILPRNNKQKIGLEYSMDIPKNLLCDKIGIPAEFTDFLTVPWEKIIGLVDPIEADYEIRLEALNKKGLITEISLDFHNGKLKAWSESSYFNRIFLELEKYKKIPKKYTETNSLIEKVTDLYICK